MSRESWDADITRLGGLTPFPGKNFVPLREDELEAIEADFRAKLPEDYRKFLATYGASTFNCLTSIRSAGPLPPSLSDDGLLAFGAFYGTNPAAHNYPSLRFVAEQFAGVIPHGLLPIAEGAGDDEICIGLTGDLRGKIYYCDSQTSEDLDSDQPSSPLPGTTKSLPNTFFIAHSFSDLLRRIEPFSDCGKQ